MDYFTINVCFNTVKHFTKQYKISSKIFFFFLSKPNKVTGEREKTRTKIINYLLIRRTKNQLKMEI